MADGKKFNTLFREALNKAGIKDFHFHDLRHTCATRLRDQGVQLEDIKTILGHSSFKMTERYAHISDKTLHEAMQKISKKQEQKREQLGS